LEQLKTDFYPSLFDYKYNILIQILYHFQVLQSDGGNYCASVNAATLALIDAGVALKDYVCACSASYLRDTSLVDINYLEESSGGPEIIVTTLPKSDQIVFLEMNGRIHEDNLSKVIDTAMKGCKDVYTILDGVVREHVTERASALSCEK
jgi:exosome complex component RRP41